MNKCPIAVEIIRMVDDARKDNINGRCPMCGWVFISSITYKEHHHENCLYLKAKEHIKKKKL